MIKKIDYQNEVQIYLKLKASGQRITQQQFCEERSKKIGQKISYAYFKEVLAKIRSQLTEKTGKTAGNGKRHDWDALKTQFLTGDYRSLSEFARAHGIAPKSESFRNKSATWKSEKEKIGRKTEEKIREQLLDEKTADFCANLNANLLQAQLSLFDYFIRLAENAKNFPEPTTAAEAKEAASFIMEMQRAIERMIPNIIGLHAVVEVNKIFDELSEEKISIAKAAIELTKLGVNLPRALEIMLSKYAPLEPEPDEGDLIDDEKILARRREMRLAEIEEERESFVADRRKYVDELKKKFAAGEKKTIH